MQKVRRQPFISEDMHRPSTACRFTISDTISLPYQGYFSAFPHGTSSLSVRLEYLGLAHGRARFLQDFPCPTVLGIPLELFKVSFTGLSPSLVDFSTSFNYPSESHIEVPQPHTEVWFSLFPFRSPLLGESLTVSFPAATQMFQFAAFASYAYGFSIRYLGMTLDGFSHSEIPGSMDDRSSPGHIAAYHVLHRLSLPSHPS